MRERLLREYDLTLDKAISMCMASEISKTQVKGIEGEPKEMHAISKWNRERRSMKPHDHNRAKKPDEESATGGSLGQTK